MDNLKIKLKSLVELKGASYVAMILCEGTTRNLQRWLKDGEKIPSTKELLVKKVLSDEGYL